MDTSFDSSDDYDGGLFTPSRGRRKSIVNDFTRTPPDSGINHQLATIEKTGNNNHINDVDVYTTIAPNTLPRLQDTSWLGARMSPIRQRPDDTEDKDDDDDDEDAAIVAPYRLGLTETSGSSTVSKLLFRPINDDDDTDNSHNNNDGVITTTIKSTGYVRPRPPLLLHPITSAGKPPTQEMGNETNRHSVGSNSNSFTRHRRRRRLIMPYEREFWTFWSLSSSSPESQRLDDARQNNSNDLDSSYVMIDPPRPIRDNGNNFVIIGGTAVVLFCIGLHDIFIAYLSIRRGITVSERRYTLAWSLPWISPTERSMLRFGAFCPDRIILPSFSSSEYWRCLTSIFITTSVVEWLILAWIWTRYIPPFSFSSSSLSKSPWQLSWPIIYLLSAFTGQLWMVAFDYNNMGSSSSSSSSLSSSNVNHYDTNYNYGTATTTSVTPSLSGCAGWASCGVLCSVGIQRPNSRFPCFILAILLIILQTCQITGNTIGCSAGSFFGWAFSGIWGPSAAFRQRLQQRELRNYDYRYDIINDTENKMLNIWNWLAVIIVTLLWLLPILKLIHS